MTGLRSACGEPNDLKKSDLPERLSTCGGHFRTFTTHGVLSVNIFTRSYSDANTKAAAGVTIFIDSKSRYAGGNRRGIAPDLVTFGRRPRTSRSMCKLLRRPAIADRVASQFALKQSTSGRGILRGASRAVQEAPLAAWSSTNLPPRRLQDSQRLANARRRCANQRRRLSVSFFIRNPFARDSSSDEQ